MNYVCIPGKWCGVLWTNYYVSCSLFPIVRTFWYFWLKIWRCYWKFSILYLFHCGSCSFYTAVNIKGVFNTSNETKYEKEAPAGTTYLIWNSCPSYSDLAVYCICFLYGKRAYAGADICVHTGELILNVYLCLNFRDFYWF